MKKLYLILATAALLLCAACGASPSVEGTWYSVTDATMYNFADGEVTVSGVVVGQYEDNGDSLVLSMTADGENLQLYVTTMDDVVVLADVKVGDGIVYFCKGFEEAKAMAEENEPEIDYDEIASTLDGFLGDFDHHEVEFDETGCNIYVGSDGFTELAIAAKAYGFDENYEEWKSMREMLISLCDTISMYLDELGVDESVFVNFINDENPENLLLIIMDGAVIYDAMAG